jgi:hypothetical protein
MRHTWADYFIYLLLSFNLMELPHFFTEFSEFSRNLNHGQQCNESCHGAISKEYLRHGWIYEKPSTALASSAVDAMFVHRSREHDDDLEPSSHDGPIPTESQFTHRGKKVDTGGTHNHHHHHQPTSAQDISLSQTQSVNRPLHLPSLIDTLVGTHHLSNNDQKDTKQRIIIRPEESKASRHPSEELKAIKEMNANAADHSIARVAAAAAVAILSDSVEEGKGTRSYTMKAFNEEWDEALRWISSWGQNQNHQVRGDTENDRRASQRFQRNSKEDTTIRAHDKSRILAQNRFDQLLERCTSDCLADQKSTKTNAKEGTSTSTRLQRDQRSTGYANIKLLPISQRMTRSIVGIILSSAVLWLFRSIIDWWKLKRYSTSLQQLLEEERTVLEPKAVTKKGKHHRTSGKQRKKKKSRNLDVHSQSTKTTHASSRPDAGQGWNDFEDASHSDSDDSFEHRYMMRESPHRHSNTLELNSDQASKGTISTVSWTTADSVQTHYTDTTKHGFKQRVRKAISRSKLEHKPHSSRNEFAKKELQVPSSAQREEAASELRAYQASQLSKFIAIKKNRQNTSTKTVSKLSMRDAVLKNLPTEPKTDTFLAPPPGFSFEKDIVDLSVKSLCSQHETEENDVDLMLSNILDEDEGANDVEMLDETAPKQFTFSSETQAITLGDLLATSPSRDSCNGTRTMRSSHNPWHSPSFDVKGDTTGLDEGLGKGDANVQLQVSAREFLPSWGKAQASPARSIAKIW